MLRHVFLVRTDVSEELIASTIRVRRIGKLETLAVTSNRSMLRLQLLVTANLVSSSLILLTLIMEATRSSETSVLWHNIAGDGIFLSKLF
jgi:hypothetical protein